MGRDNSASFKTDRELLEELAGRARRTETKATQIADQLGVETGSKPTYDHAQRIVWVKTTKTSLEDVIDCVPPEHREGQPIDVRLAEKLLMECYISS